ncbi:MAG: PAS domain S-box protein [Candidatus Sumerlaeota bacterium]|nr:PAS domain S-box protein [Candidatus Sumerlaeota bacterium]
MSLRATVICWLSVIFLASLALVYAVERELILPGFDAWERSEAQRQVQRCVSALDREVDQIALYLQSWSSWDDSYAFVEDGNRAFIENNVSDAVFSLPRLNLLYIFNNRDEMVFGVVRDYQTLRGITFSHPPLQELFRQCGLLDNPTTNSRHAGLCMTERGPLLVASLPILTSLCEGPSRGSMITGRLLGEDMVETLREQTQVNVTFLRLPGADLSPDDREAVEGLRGENEVLIQEQGPDRLFAYCTIPDLLGDPLLLLRAEVPRSISQRGRLIARSAMLSFLAVGLAAFLIILWILEKQALRPIGALGRDVVRIAGNGDLRERVGTYGSREVAGLCGEINRMLTDLESARRDLAESEARYRNIVDEQRELICRFTPDLALTFANHSYACFAGKPPEDLVGVDFMSMIGEEFEEAVRTALEHAAADREDKNRECRLIQGNGEAVWINWNFHPTFDAEGRLSGYQTVGRNVTERRKAEEARRRSEARYHMLFNEMLNAFVIHEVLFDDNGRAFDFRILEMNPAFEKLSGWKAADVIGKTRREIHPEAESTWLGTFAEVASTGKPAHFEGYSHAFGKFVEATAFCPEKGKCAVIFSDITQRKRAEESLQRLATVVEQTSEAIVVTDLTGAIQYVNPAFARITGYAREEAIGQNPRFLKSGKQSARFYQDLWGTITGGEVWTGRFTNKKKDGSLYEEEAAISPIRDGAAGIVSFVAVKRDVTEQVKLETQLRHAQKMEAVGQLAGGVAHDFNNLLQAILGYTQMALFNLAADHPARPEMFQVLKATERAAVLVRQLLTFSRRQIVQAQNLDLNQVIGDLLKMLRRVLGEHVELDILAGPDLRPIHADPGQMEQVLMNLCVNARDAMPEGGKIAIETRNVDLDAEFCAAHEGSAPGPHVMLFVTDTGVGMPPDVKERIFEPFFTTKEVGKGTGLGLATVYGIVRQHQGVIEVDSVAGFGSTFRVCFPAVPAPRPAGAKPPEETAPRGGKETILLAEDEEIVRNLGTRILERGGYRVLTACNGEEAVRVFEDNAEAIRLAVVDVVMPKLSGRAVCERLHARKPGVPVLFCSGYGAHYLSESFVLSPDIHLIQKPYKAADLLNRVRDLLDQAPTPNAQSGAV